MSSWLGVLYCVVCVLVPVAYVLGWCSGKAQRSAQTFLEGRIAGARAARQWQRMCDAARSKRPHHNPFPFNPPT